MVWDIEYAPVFSIGFVKSWYSMRAEHPPGRCCPPRGGGLHRVGRHRVLLHLQIPRMAELGISMLTFSGPTENRMSSLPPYIDHFFPCVGD